MTELEQKLKAGSSDREMEKVGRKPSGDDCCLQHTPNCLPATCYSLPTAYNYQPTPYYLLPTTDYLRSTA